MPVETTSTDTRSQDLVRVSLVLAAVVLQTVAGALGGSGALGEAVGVVANSYPTLLLPGGGAFAIWSLIYVWSIALAVRAALPRQQSRAVQRSVGWWFAAAGVLNAAWILVFTQRWLVVAEVLIVALLAVLGVSLVRLRSHPATGWADRLLLHTPIGVYAGWVTMATVAGAATTGQALGITPPRPLAVTLAVVTALGTAGLAALATVRIGAVAGYAAAVIWALAWIAAATSPWPVVAAATVGLLAVLGTAGWLCWRAENPTRIALG